MTALPHHSQLRALDHKSSELTHSVLELTATNSKQAEEIGRLKLCLKEGEKAKRDLERWVSTLTLCLLTIASL